MSAQQPTSDSNLQTPAYERKMKMHEAREAIVNRLAPNIHSEIDLDKFLRAVVAELGRMMDVDRCDVLQLARTGELRISHEWRATPDIPSSLGTTFPVDFGQLADRFDLSRPIRIDDTQAPGLDPRIGLLPASLGTRSLLVVPVVLDGNPLGLVGLHATRELRRWDDEEVSFLQAIARQIAVGYQYARLFVDNRREANRTRALLEIANLLNSRSDFGELTSHVLERANELVGADYCALGVVEPSGKAISLAAFKAAPQATTLGVRKLIESNEKTINISQFPAIVELLTEPKTLRLIDADLPEPVRSAFNSILGGRAALVAPVPIGGQTFGLLGFVWGGEREGFDEEEVALVEGIAVQIGTALEREQLTAEVLRLRYERRAGDRIIGSSEAIQKALLLVEKVATTDTNVLIQGESGTGKELIADLIHYSSRRKEGPYIKLNCGAIPETLLESELFGHERGAFTDAHQRRRGRFEEADGGTLFLDEIGEMSLAAQVRLLRVLQDGEFTRVGGSEIVKADVRVIAASNVDLARAIEQKSFRSDLFYRLSVFPIHLPPLRERPGDIHTLVMHFLEHYKQKTGRFVSGISRQALNALIGYEWPGNVRELENAVERAIIIASGRQIELDDLPEQITRTLRDERSRTRGERERAAAEGRQLTLEIEVPATIDEIERRAIEATLDYTGGDKTRAARSLGIGRKTLYRKLRQYDGDAGAEQEDSQTD